MRAQSPQAYAKITREVATLSRLQHPSVVRYYQVGVASQGCKVNAANLQNHLRRFLGPESGARCSNILSGHGPPA